MTVLYKSLFLQVKFDKMEPHHSNLDPNHSHYISQQSYDPHQNVQTTMMQPIHQQQQEHIYYPQNQGLEIHTIENQGYNPQPPQVQGHIYYVGYYGVWYFRSFNNTEIKLHFFFYS